MLSSVGAYRGTGVYEHAILRSDKKNNFELVGLEFSERASVTSQLREHKKNLGIAVSHKLKGS